MKIGRHTLGNGTYIIAEAGINHNGQEILAHRLIEAAKDAGADAVKFQMFHTNAVVERRGPTAQFLDKYEFPKRIWRVLFEHCQEIGITFLASVFDEVSAAEYFALRPVAVKIGSGELHCLPLIHDLARYGRPIILSTGMATPHEISEAMTAAKLVEVALLHCVSAYPAPPEDVNLRALDTLGGLGCPVGYSDHTTGTAIAVAAVARGACIIEKHLTLDCTLPGPDHRASAHPQTFAAMVSGIRRMEIILGDGIKRCMDSERETRRYCRGMKPR